MPVPVVSFSLLWMMRACPRWRLPSRVPHGAQQTEEQAAAACHVLSPWAAPQGYSLRSLAAHTGSEHVAGPVHPILPTDGTELRLESIAAHLGHLVCARMCSGGRIQ